MVGISISRGNRSSWKQLTLQKFKAPFRCFRLNSQKWKYSDLDFLKSWPLPINLPIAKIKRIFLAIF